MKDKTQTITLSIVWLFFCCYFLQAFDFSNALTVVLGGILCLVMIRQQKRVRVDVGICLLTVTMVSYYVIVNGIQGLKFPILYIPLVVFVLSNYAAYSVKGSKNSDSKFLMLMFALIVGYAIYGILNSYMYYAGYVVPGTRRWQDFWSGEIVPGTQHTAYFLPVLAMFLPAVVYFKRRKWTSSLLVLLTAFFCYTSLVTKSRMPLVIAAIVFCVQAVLYVIFEKDKVKTIFSNKKIWGAGIVALGLIAIGVFLVKDSDIVVSFIDNMGKGGGIINNVRFQAQKLAIEQLFDYPMGGRKMELGRNYCHNTWLDMANAGGVIPFFGFAAYTAFSLYEVIRLLTKKTISTEAKIVTVGMYLAFFLYLTVEPAMDASIHLVTPWIYMNGLICGYLWHK